MTKARASKVGRTTLRDKGAKRRRSVEGSAQMPKRVLIEGELLEHFPDAAAVNAALWAVVHDMKRFEAEARELAEMGLEDWAAGLPD